MADTTGGKIVWILDAETGQLERALGKARSEVNKTAKEVDNKFVASMNRATDASKAFAVGLGGIVAAGASAIGFGVRIAGQLEAATQGFVALLGSADAAGKTMARIKKEAAATPFELTGLVAGTQALAAITKDGDKAIDILLDVGRAISTAGKGQAELDSVVANLQQVAATGVVTELDIRQFQRAIPIFNDILAASNLTSEGLKDSTNSAELLFDAFRKAGEAGGIAAQGFTSQAGTFNQLWSNLVDTVTIGLSTFVQTSGVFDVIKDAMSDLINTINQFTTPEAIQGFLIFLRDNGPIIAGVIIGGLVPAFTAWAASVWALMAPLIPFIAIGALIGYLVQQLVNHFGGWEEVMKKIQPTLNALGAIFNDWIKPALDQLWDSISNRLIPAWQNLMLSLEPLMPLFKMVAIVIGVTLLAAIIIIIAILTTFIDIISWVANQVSGKITSIIGFFQWLYDELVGHSIIPDLINGIAEWFSRLPAMITEGLGGLLSAISTPFKNAFDGIKNMASNVAKDIRKSLSDAFNIDKRNSPSIRDRLNEVKRTADSILSSIEIPTFSSEIGSSFGDMGVDNGNFELDPTRSLPPITVNLGMYAGSDMEKRELADQFRRALINYDKGKGANV